MDIVLSEDLLELEGIEEIRKEWGHYQHEEIGIPRVTHILSQCEDQNGLIQWAANIGRRKYDFYRERAMNIGTIVHTVIDDYIMYHKNDPNYKIQYNDFYLFEPDYKQYVDQAFMNFKLWLNMVEKSTGRPVEVIGVEIPLTCPWFGGTTDAIFKIGGCHYIIDFKTSKQISVSYLIQTAAYMWLINHGYIKGLPHIDGIGIIRVDKNRQKVDDLFLNETDPYQGKLILDYQKCFMSYVDSYYRNKSADYTFNKYINNYIVGEFNYGNNQ